MQILLGILDSIRRGISWATGTITSLLYRDAVYAPLANGSFFAFGESNSAASTASYSYSTNGNSWSTGTLPATGRWSATATNGSRIIVFRESSSTGYYSDNGTTWTITNALDGANTLSPRSCIWNGTQFVTTGSNGTVRYSTDGITWSGVSIGAGSQSTTQVGYDGISRHITFQGVTDITSGRTTTTFPTGWATTTFPYASLWGRFVYGGGLWILLRPGTSSYISSTNGTSWTMRTLPSSISDTTNDRDAKMFYDGGKFFYYYADNIYSSANGIDWITETTVTGDTLDQVNGWAVGPNKVVGVGSPDQNVGSGIYLNGSK